MLMMTIPDNSVRAIDFFSATAGLRAIFTPLTFSDVTLYNFLEVTIDIRYSILTVGVVSDGFVAGHLVQRGNIEWDQLRFWAGDVFGQVG